MFLISYHCISIILMKTKQGFMFRVLLFFTRIAGKELVKVSLISTLCGPCCQLSETPDTSDTMKTGNLWNGNFCEMDCREVERRWVVIPRGGQRAMGKGRAVGVGLVGRRHGWQRPVAAPVILLAWAELFALGLPPVEKNLPTPTRARKVRWASRQAASPRLPWRPDSDRFAGFPISS